MSQKFGNILVVDDDKDVLHRQSIRNGEVLISVDMGAFAETLSVEFASRAGTWKRWERIHLGVDKTIFMCYTCTLSKVPLYRSRYFMSRPARPCFLDEVCVLELAKSA